jgi:tetratricopeptide (TPR) repeat protein
MAGQNAEAAADYRKTLELKPGLYEAQLNLGVVLISLKQPAQAAAVLKTPSRRNPRSSGQLLLRRSPVGRRSSRGRRSVVPRGPGGRPEIRRGKCRARPGAHPPEQTHRRCRSTARVGRHRGLLELAAQYEKAGETAEAIAIYEPFAARQPPDPAVLERLGVLMMNSGRAGEAIPHLEKSVKLSPTAANQFALATAYLRDKQPQKANETLSSAIAADPKNAELYLASAGLHRDQKNFKAAAEQFWRVTQLQPESKEAWSGMATMLLSLENYPQAIAAFDKLESLGDASPGVYFLRALAFDKMQNYKAPCLTTRSSSPPAATNSPTKSSRHASA